jgi:predicted transposase YbfD/YdcC
LICPVPAKLPDQDRWKNLAAIGLAVGTTIRDGKVNTEFRDYVLNRVLTAKRFGEAVRGHWSVENQLHWQLDVTLLAAT